MKQFLDFIFNFVDITGNELIDNILIGIVGLISFYIAFDITGKIICYTNFGETGIYSSIHWIIRICTALALMFITLLIIQFIKWFHSLQIWIRIVTYVALAVLSIIIGIIIYIRCRNRTEIAIEQTNINNKSTQEIKIENNKQELKQDKIYRCPFCGGKLVKRHSQYGYFYGCENYFTKGCKYTKKIK